MNLLGCWLAKRLRDGSRSASTSEDSPPSDSLMRTAASFVDLADRSDLTFALMADTRSWRERAVHEIVLRDSDHVNVSTAYQVRLPVDLIRKFAPAVRPGDQVRLLLPFAIRPKQLLLNVNFTGVKNEPCALLPREKDAELQAAYLEHLDREALGNRQLLSNLWIGVSAYTVSAWHEHLARTKPRAWRRLLPGFQDLWRTRALGAYLNADLGLDIGTDHIARWLIRVEDARQILVDALGEGEDPESSSECILLAIPYMPFRPNDIQEIDILIKQFCTAVKTMNDTAARTLAEYGRRWEAILETVVPVGQACSIKLHEQRPWRGAPPSARSAALDRIRRIGARSHALQQSIVLGEAKTTHVEIRAADHDVVLDKPRVTDLVGLREGIALVDEVRETQDAVAIYAAGSERRNALVQVRARVRRGHRFLVSWLVVVTVAAGLVAVQLPEDNQLVESLALLIFPLTLAGAVVLWRDTTSLAERLLRPWRMALVLVVSSIWVMTLGRLLLRADVSWAEWTWARVVHVVT